MKSKEILFSILFFCISYFVNAQKNEAYHLKVIDTTKNKYLKLASLDSLIYDYNNQKDFKVFANRTEQYVDLALELEKYDDALEFTIRGFFSINNKLSQKKRALKLLEKVGVHLDKIKDPYLIGGFYVKKAAVFSSTKEYKKAIENYTKAINNYSDKDSTYKADAYYFRGNQNFFNGNYKRAIDDYKIAANYYENLGDKLYYFYTQASIINVYGVNGFNHKTIEERKKIIQKKIDNKFTSGLYIEHYNQSLNYKKLDSTKQQEESLLNAYEILKEQKKIASTYHKIILISTLSSFYSINNKLGKAKKYLDEAEVYFLKQDSKSNASAEFLRAKSRYFFKAEKYNIAIKAADDSFKIAKDNGLVTSMMHSSELLSKINAKLGRNDKALSYYKKYSKIKDSIFSVTKTNALSYYQTLYETEKKEKEINKQKASIDLLAKDNKAKERLLLFGGLGLLFLFTMIYLYRNKIQSEKKRKMQEEYSQKLLISQEEERKRISKDLHDSLGQSLLLIKNKVALKKDDKTQELVNNAIEEMRSISRVLHPFQLEEIGISRALENLISQLDENYKDIFIFGDIDDIKDVLSPQQEVNLFRIVQECLSNIIKHAKADSAKIVLLNKEEKIIISIKDNGIGFDFSEKYNDFKSLGLKTIKERVKFLNGNLKIDSIKKQGTTFTINFPKV